jgi:hypothetical protein
MGIFSKGTTYPNSQQQAVADRAAQSRDGDARTGVEARARAQGIADHTAAKNDS